MAKMTEDMKRRMWRGRPSKDLTYYMVADRDRREKGAEDIGWLIKNTDGTWQAIAEFWDPVIAEPVTDDLGAVATLADGVAALDFAAAVRDLEETA